MKKRILILALIICLLLCGCRELTIRGEMMGWFSNGETGICGFSIRRENGDGVSVIVDGHTHIFSWVEDITVSDFKAGTMDGIVVDIKGDMKQDTIYATEIQIEGRWFRNEYTLSDGTGVDLFKASRYHTYSLEDGRELLFVQNPTNVEETYIPGIGSLKDLPEAAQEKIKAYYDAQGLLYDELQTLEDAYDAYLAGENFQTYTLGQEVFPSAVNEEVIYFLTIVSLQGSELRLCAAFDRQTGEEIPMEKIFICEPRELIQRMAEISGITDRTLIEEMMAAFRLDYVTVSQNYLEVNFPAGTLPSEELAFGMGFEYNQDVCKLIQPWALPNGGTE